MTTVHIALLKVGSNNAVWWLQGELLHQIRVEFPRFVMAGLLWFVTIIGIPFGVQSFKFAQLSLAPFGKEIVRAKDVTAALGAPQA